MAKKAGFYMEAERLFVQERMTVDAIARQLPVSERTLGDWRRDGKWDKLRAAFAESNSKTHEKLYTLIQRLTDKAIQSAEEGTEPSQSQLYFIAKMAPLLLKLQGYEEAVEKPAEEEPPKRKGLTEETIRRIEEEILGLKR
jgi:hypothetical protein